MSKGVPEEVINESKEKMRGLILLGIKLKIEISQTFSKN